MIWPYGRQKSSSVYDNRHYTHTHIHKFIICLDSRIVLNCNFVSVIIMKPWIFLIAICLCCCLHFFPLLFFMCAPPQFSLFSCVSISIMQCQWELLPFRLPFFPEVEECCWRFVESILIKMCVVYHLTVMTSKWNCTNVYTMCERPPKCEAVEREKKLIIRRRTKQEHDGVSMKHCFEWRHYKSLLQLSFWILISKLAVLLNVNYSIVFFYIFFLQNSVFTWEIRSCRSEPSRRFFELWCFPCFSYIVSKHVNSLPKEIRNDYKIPVQCTRCMNSYFFNSKWSRPKIKEKEGEEEANINMKTTAWASQPYFGAKHTANWYKIHFVLLFTSSCHSWFVLFDFLLRYFQLILSKYSMCVCVLVTRLWCRFQISTVHIL